MISWNFYLLIILIDFGHVIRQSARKLSPNFFLGSANRMGIILHHKQIFPAQSYSSVIIFQVQFCKDSKLKSLKSMLGQKWSQNKNLVTLSHFAHQSIYMRWVRVRHWCFKILYVVSNFRQIGPKVKTSSDIL